MHELVEPVTPYGKSRIAFPAIARCWHSLAGCGKPISLCKVFPHPVIKLASFYALLPSFASLSRWFAGEGRGESL
jgi:hypothetical protein